MEAGTRDLQALGTLHPAVGDLASLLAALQARGLVTGTERAQHAAALLARLSAAGIALDPTETAAAWLAPVLCVTAHDRTTLAAQLATRGTAGQAPAALPRRIPALAGEALVIEAERAALRPWMGAALGGGALCLVVLALAVADFGTGGGVTELFVPPSRRIPLSLAWLADWAGYLVPAMAVLLGMLLLAIRRRAAAVALPPPALPATTEGLHWYDEAALQGALRMAGRQVRAATRKLDLSRTIAATIDNAGWPELVRGGRPRTPEHLVLVQLAGPADPQRLAAAALMARLVAADLRAVGFAFHGRPDFLLPLDGGAAVPLARIAGLYRGARLLLLSDGEVLHDRLSDTPASPPAFDAFPVRVLLTPVPAAQWQRREHAYLRAGWQVFDQSSASLGDLARWLSGPREERLLSADTATMPDFAALLAQDQRLFAAEPPAAETRARLRDRLARYLDPDPLVPPHGFDLLRVLAFGVVLDAGAVARLAAHLDALSGVRPDEPTVRRLTRLPWFTMGGLPEWLRRDLLRDLPDELRMAGRRAWLLYLADQNVSRAALTVADEARLAAEAQRRLAHPETQADALMREMIAAAPPARRGFSRLELVLLVLLVSAAWGAIWGISRMGPVVQHALELAAGELAAWGRDSFGWMPEVGMIPGRPWTPLFTIALAATTLWIRNRWARRGLGALAFLLAIGPLWLVFSGTQGVEDVENPALFWVGALQAVIGLLGLAALAPGPRDPVPKPLLFLPAHPWLDATILLLLGVFGYITLVEEGTDTSAALRLAAAISEAGFALMFAGAVALRFQRAGAIDARQAVRLSLAMLAGQLVGAGLAQTIGAIGIAVAAGLQVLVQVIALDLRLAAMVAAAAWITGTLDMRRAAFAFGVYLAVMAGAVWMLGGGGIPGSSILVLISVPLRAALAMAVAYAAGVRPRWGIAVLVVAAGTIPEAIYFLLDGLGVQFGGLDTFSNVMWLVGMPEWLLLWPLVRAMRPDLGTPSDGLWWRCLLLPACCIGVMVAGVRIGLAPLLLVPIACWIASRHGTRALPAMALAMLPTAIQFSSYNATFGFIVNGSVGEILAALLAAKFVADRAFREACLGATTLSRWQVAALVLLPFGYASPVFAGFRLSFFPASLVIVLAALIGFSRVQLRAPMLALAFSCFLAFGLTVAFGLPGDDAVGRIVHGLRDFPASVVTIVFALGLSRMLRDGSLLPEGEGLLRKISAQPAQYAIVVAVLAWLFGLTLQLHRDTSQPDVLNLMPFLSVHFRMLAFYWAAAGATAMVMFLGRTASFPVLIAGLVQLVLLLAPGIDLQVTEWLSLRLLGGAFGEGLLLGRQPFDAIAVIAVVWAWHRLGQALPQLLPIAAQPREVSQPTPQLERAMVK